MYPGDEKRAVLLRRVRAGDGAAQVLAVLDPRADYGRRPVGTWRRDGGCWWATGHGLQVRWWGAPTARPHRAGGADRMEVELRLEPRAHHDLVLEVLRDDGAGVGGRAIQGDGEGGPDPDELWRATEEAWAREVPPCGDVVAARDVRRSYAVLRGMTGPGGGTVAAATTSLPERAESDRNYDYRYVWIRDTCYVGRAGAALPGGDAVLDDAVRFVVERLLADGGELVPAYRHDGGPVTEVRKLDLPGYPGGTDVVGNVIGSQFQLDVFGEALLLLAAAAARDRLDPEGWRAARVATETIGRRWHEPDAGLWELTPPRMWTASRLVCVAGLRALASCGAPPAWTSGGVTLADAILAETAAASLHPSGRWQRTPEDDRVDASLLLAQLRGAVPSDDPRSAATRAAVEAELSQDEYVYRYTRPGRPLGDEEGAFLICSFWMSMASWAAGDRVGPCAGSSGRARRPGRLGSSPRSSTWPSTSSAATCRRRSSMPPWSRRRLSRGTPEAADDAGRRLLTARPLGNGRQ